MATWLVVLVPVAMLGVAVPLVLVVVLLRATPGRALLPQTEAARRHAVVGGGLASVLAALALVVYVPVVSTAGLRRPGGVPGLLLVLAPAVAGLVHTGVLAVIELTWPRPRGVMRSARLSPRGLADVTPRVMATALGAAVAAVAVTTAACALLADESGRALSRSTPDSSRSAGPFPGLPYAGPAALGVLAVLVAALVTLHLVVSRPAVAGADPATDEALRRASAHRVLRGALVATLLVLGPLLVTAGAAGRHVADAGSGGAATGVAVLGALTLVTAAVVLCVPAQRVPAAEPASVTRTA